MNKVKPGSTMEAMVERNQVKNSGQEEADSPIGRMVIVPERTWKYCKAKANELSSSTRPVDEYHKILDDGLLLNVLLDQGLLITVHTADGGETNIQNVFDDVLRKKDKKAMLKSDNS